MSDRTEPNIEPRQSDRRVRRTRAALSSAFNRLVLTKGFEALTAADIAVQANIGRSTFYEHYQGKEDILAQSLIPVLAPLADSCFNPQPSSQLVFAMEHFLDNRKLARALMAGRARRVMVRELVRLVEQTLAAELTARGRGKPALPTAIVAAQLASGQLAMVEEWLSGRHGCSAADIAAALQASSHAVAGVLMRST